MAWKLNVAELLHFFDESPTDSKGHASAIVAIAGEELCTSLLQVYLMTQRGYSKTEIVMRGDKPWTPTTGLSSGWRLDRWLAAQKPGGQTDLYQIEIKNWSAHAIGGKIIAVDAQTDVLQKTSAHYWRQVWDHGKGALRDDNVGKVLTKMKVPPQFENRVTRVIPLLCFWWYITDPETHKRKGVGFETRTFKGRSGTIYLVFKTPRGDYHAYVEIEAKEAAQDSAAKPHPRTENTRKMWDELWKGINIAT